MAEDRISIVEKILEEISRYVYSQIPLLSGEIKDNHRFANEVSAKADITKALDTRIKDHAEMIDNLNKTINQMKNEVDKNIAKVNDNANSYRENSANRDLTEKWLKDLEEKFSSINVRMKGISNEYEETKKKVKEHVELRSGEISSQMCKKHKEMDAFQDQMKEKIDIVSLDNTNSVLRCQVLDQQVKVIEKKIENIYLLLRKYDLSQ